MPGSQGGSLRRRQGARTDSLERDVTVIFQEFDWLQEIDHPSLIRIREHGHADTELTRPYVVLEYFEAQTLS